MNILPPCPPTSVIVRWGRKKDEGISAFTRKIRYYVSKLKYLSLAHPPQRRLIRLPNRIDIRRRVIAVYEDQFDLVSKVLSQLIREYSKKLRRELDDAKRSGDSVRIAEATLDLTEGCPFSNLYGYELMPFPRQKSLGGDRDFLEQALIRNPGYVLMIDADISHCFSRNRYSGIPYHSPEDFTAVVCHALRVAVLLKLKFWGISPDLNSHVNWGSEPVPVDVQKNYGFKVGREYIRNFFGIAKDAAGSWGPGRDFLEDKWRSLSEYQNNPRSVGLWWNDQIRFPRTEENTTTAYVNKPEYREAFTEIEEEFGQRTLAQMGHLQISKQRAAVAAAGV